MQDLRLSALDFAENIGLLTYSKSVAINYTTLGLAHNQGLAWAATVVGNKWLPSEIA
jgi:hypothetical protein